MQNTSTINFGTLFHQVQKLSGTVLQVNLQICKAKIFSSDTISFRVMNSFGHLVYVAVILKV